MAFLKTEALVIKTFDLREADKIITFFSRDYGKIQGIAKGIRKIKARYSGKLELFTRVHVIFFQKKETLQHKGFAGSSTLLRITQVDVVEVFPQLKNDFNKIIGASYITEFLNKLFEEHDNTHKEVYFLVCDTFRTLAASENLRNILPAFEIKLLAHLGYAPILDRCTVCGTTKLATETQSHRDKQDSGSQSRSNKLLGFSSSTGGVLCQRCKPLKKDTIDISLQSVNILRRFLHTGIKQISTIPMPKGKFHEIKTLLTNHFQYHVGISLKTEAFVQKLRAARLTV
jgi:DNA repair protein RecO (recombination protein O)